MEEQTAQIGLLMEAAHAQQQLAQSTVAELTAHIGNLDGVVREEIRRTLIEEMRMVSAETRSAAQSLQGLRRAATARIGLCSTLVAIGCAAIPSAVAWLLLPTPAQIAVLRAQRDALAASVALLRSQGGGIDLRRCGETSRFCVRVDRQARAFGEHGDYLIVKGN